MIPQPPQITVTPPPPSRSSDIERVRELILEVHADVRKIGKGSTLAKLMEAYGLTFRAKADKVTRARHPSPTVGQCRRTRILRHTTDWSVERIGREVNLNSGRVSEINNGKWLWHEDDSDDALAERVDPQPRKPRHG